MTAQEILKQAFKNKCEMDCRIEMILELKDLATRITQITKGVPNVSNSCKSKIEIAITDIQEQSEKLGDEVLKYLETRAKIADTISVVVDDNERLILTYRYLTFQTWKKIAKEMNISTRRVLQLHAQALNSFEKIFQAED